MTSPYRLRLVPRPRDDEPPPADPGSAVAAAPLVRVGRQAIFDAGRNLFGFELLFRADGGESAQLHTPRERDVATSQVLSAALGDFGAAAIGDGLPLFVNLTRAFVLGDLPLAVDPAAVVLEVTEEIWVDDAVLAGLARLRAEGYRIALDDFEGEQWRLPSLPHADYVKLVLGVEPGARERLAGLVALVREHAPSARIIVERVEDDDDFAFCRALGVDYFQGFGLERPVVLTTPSMDAGAGTALRLIAALGDPETSTDELERIVSSDPGLSMKVLRAASSSAVAPISPIGSVRQAIVLLGPRALASWTTLMVLSSGFTTAQRQSALTFVLARAGACTRVATADAHVAHTVGLLSGMAEALDVGVDELLAQVRLHDDVTAALHRFEGPAGRALAAVLVSEDGGAPVPAAALAAAGHDDRAALAYLSALGEAMALTATVGT